MEENNKSLTSAPAEAEAEIDLLELAQKLWAERKLILKWCGIAAIVGLVVAFSIPKEYTTAVKLAPESADGKGMGGNLGALASMAGINLGGGGGADAVNPDLYPDVVASVPFVVRLFDVEVTDRKGELHTDVYHYIDEELRAPWWSAVVGAPFRLLGWTLSLFRSEEKSTGKQGTDLFRLSEEETRIVEALRQRISVAVDKKSSVVTLAVTMQDPLISATLTDTVMHNLQEYITQYRTNKARHDLKYMQQLCDEAQQQYYDAQQAYARYMDANQNIVLRSVRIEQERLQNEMNLYYNLYNQTAQQLQVAKAKVQESTPVYAVVQPATVPIRASKPSKPMILVGFVFLAAVAASGWVLFGRETLRQLRQR